VGSSGRGDRLSYALKGSDRACMEAGANRPTSFYAQVRSRLRVDTPPTSFYAQVRSHVTMTPP